MEFWDAFFWGNDLFLIQFEVDNTKEGLKNLNKFMT